MQLMPQTSSLAIMIGNRNGSCQRNICAYKKDVLRCAYKKGATYSGAQKWQNYLAQQIKNVNK